MIYDFLTDKSHKKLVVLIDPDKTTGEKLEKLVHYSRESSVDAFFVGSSLLLNEDFENCITYLKKYSSIPVILFPGNHYQVSSKADAMLMLSLVSGRNPEFLIGQQVLAAPMLKQSGIEVLPAGYILIDGGRVSSTSYITQTIPIPNNKPDLAIATALAAEMLGMKLVYLEAGSGAIHTVSREIIKAVSNNISLPVIVGGGIRSSEQAEALCKAGADILVVGNILEKEPELLMDISLAVHSAKTMLT